jgi:hypothetical protein
MTPLHAAFIDWIRSEADGTLAAMRAYLETEYSTDTT